MKSLLAQGRRGVAAWLSTTGLNRVILGIPYFWLLLFFLAPFAMVFKISLSEPITASPPYLPFFERTADGQLQILATLENYTFLLTDKLYLYTYWSSVKTAALATLAVLLVGYPMAYAITRAPRERQALLLMLVIIPFWTSFLIRVYALIGLLNTHGVINKVLLWLGLIDAPIQMMYTNFAVFVGIVYSYLPFMILPLYASLEKLDISLLDAASDLGAGPVRRFLTVTLPLSMPGIIAGCMLVFIPAMGEYVIPDLMGGADNLMIGRVLYDEFLLNRDWPVSSAIAVVLLMLLLAPIAVLRYYQDKQADAS